MVDIKISNFVCSLGDKAKKINMSCRCLFADVSLEKP